MEEDEAVAEGVVVAGEDEVPGVSTVPITAVTAGAEATVTTAGMAVRRLCPRPIPTAEVAQAIINEPTRWIGFVCSPKRLMPQ